MRLAMKDKPHANFVFNKKSSVQCLITIISSPSLLQRFDSHFSDALHKEYSSKGIIVQV